MRIYRIKYYEEDRCLADESYRIIRDCGLIVAGTDTVYGLITTPYSDECVEKVFRVKRRPHDKPIPILASSTKAVFGIVEADETVKRFLEAVWPGPVTVILRVREKIFSDLVAGGEYIGLRVPATPMIRLIAGMNGGFVTGTSANITGLNPPCVIDEAINQLGENVDLYIDLGRSPICKPSTVVSLVDGRLEVIREGPVSTETLKQIYNLARS